MLLALSIVPQFNFSLSHLALAVAAFAGLYLLGQQGQPPADGAAGMPAAPGSGGGWLSDALRREVGDVVQFVADIGLPALVPMLKDIMLGNFLTLPAHFQTLLAALRDKQGRKQIVHGFLDKQLDYFTGDAAKREELFAKLEKRLGYALNRGPAAAAAPAPAEET
jgi:hypothetical protein